MRGWTAFVVLALGMARLHAQEMRLYECVRTSTPPKIDGRLDDECWRGAEEANSFTLTMATEPAAPSVQTHFRIVYDDYNLYIAVRCDEPHLEKIKADVTERDSASVCGDDCIEIFLHPNPDQPDYFQLATNAHGVRYDGRVLDGSWNAHWQAATQFGKDAWTVECVIALSSFPDRRSLWRFNMNRELRSTGKLELHCWSNTYGAFHTPSRFGYLLFAGSLDNLHRGYLIQAARYAWSTVEKQGVLETQMRECREMCASIPRAAAAPFSKSLADLTRAQEALIQKYSKMTNPSVSEWEAFDRDLDSLIARSGKIYWELKFHALLND
jgi:hypothetical protein